MDGDLSEGPCSTVTDQWIGGGSLLNYVKNNNNSVNRLELVCFFLLPLSFLPFGSSNCSYMGPREA